MVPDPQKETFEKQEVRSDKEITPTSNISSSSIMPPLLCLADGFKQLQDLIKRIVDFLQIPLEEVKELCRMSNNLCCISSSACIMLPINEAFSDPEKIIWHTPTPVPLTCKKADKNTMSPLRTLNFYFHIHSPNPLWLIL